MDKRQQLNQVAQNMVKILSDWKDENDKYKASIDQLQAGMEMQVASLQNFIESNLPSQSNAAIKNIGNPSNKRPLPQSSSNESGVQPKRTKNNDAEPVASTSGGVMDYNTMNGTNASVMKRTPKPFVMISPMAIKTEKDEVMIMVNSRTAGKLTVAAKTGELRQTLSDRSGVNNLPRLRTIRRDSKEPSLAIVLAQKSLRAKVAAQTLPKTQSKQSLHSPQSSPASEASNKENESFTQGTPLTSTPNLASVAKKSAVKAVAAKGTQVAKKPGKAMNLSAMQNTGRILTRRASKM